MEKLLKEIEGYSDKYEFTFQFWGAGNNNVYITKDGTDLADFGGFESIETVLIKTLEYLYKINKVPYSKRINNE